MEQKVDTQPKVDAAKENLTEKVKDFYRKDFKQILLNFIRRPEDGVLENFRNPTEKVYRQSLILYGSVFVLYIIGSFILLGELRSNLSFGAYIKIGLAPVLTMLCISALGFGVKSIGGKPNFKRELLTGGLCGLPLAFLVVIAIAIKIFIGENLLSIINNPGNVGLIGIILIFFIFLMLFNIFQQSLVAAEVNKAKAWYISPIAIFVSIYISVNIMYSFF